MGCPSDHGKLTEVLVESHQDASFRMGSRENLLITWIDIPITGPDDVVAVTEKLVLCSAPDTGIEQELQDSVSTANGSRRSCATSR